VLSPKVLGSMEFGCALAGSRLILVLGHTRCGAVMGAVDRVVKQAGDDYAPGCKHLGSILDAIETVVDPTELDGFLDASKDQQYAVADKVSRRNVQAVVRGIAEASPVLAKLVEDRRIAIVGALYDISTGTIEFMTDDALGLTTQDLADVNGDGKRLDVERLRAG